MSGAGFPEDVIDNINLNDDNIDKYIIENIPYAHNSDKFKFKFSSDNKEHRDLDEYKFMAKPPKFLGKGAMTAVYKIKLIEQESDTYTIPDKYNDSLILRIFKNDLYSDIIGTQYNVGENDENNDDQSSFINMWMNHKKLFSENIIDLFMYGEIKLNDVYMGFYTITRTYIDYKIINNFDLKIKIKYFKNLLLFLQKLIEKNYTYRDLKIANIGAELVDDEYKFIVLDYDNYTILNKDDLDLLKSQFNIEFVVGTYTPLYIFEQQRNFNHDYMFVGGLLYTIIELFKNDLTDNPDYAIFYEKLNNYIGINESLKINYYIRQYIEYIDSNNFRGLLEIKRRIESLEPFGRDLITTINSKKFDAMVTPIDKLICLLGIIIKGCISLNYEPVKKIINIQHFIIALDDILSAFDGVVGGYYNKYMKYKIKYLSLKNKNI